MGISIDDMKTADQMWALVAEAHQGNVEAWYALCAEIDRYKAFAEHMQTEANAAYLVWHEDIDKQAR